MAILFFEGFNIQNTDLSPYLDPLYWSRPVDLNYPKLAYTSDTYSPDTHTAATYGHLRISGYRLDSNPPESATPLQLSGISELNSNKIYLSFRIQGLTHNDMYNNTFPFAAKLFTLCNGNDETLTFDVVRTSGNSIQGGSSQWIYANSGLGVSVKQSGNEIGLFDLRVGDLPNYALVDTNRTWPFDPQPYSPLGISIPSLQVNRYIHLEFLINKNNSIINLKLEGFDVLNRLTNPASYSPDASGQPIGNINNIKFYNRGVADDGSINGQLSSSYGINNGAITLDDLAICNDSGNSPNIWMGPKTRIYLLNRGEANFNTLDKDEWTKIGGVPAIDSRDGDNSYISSDTSGSITSVRFGNGSIASESQISLYFQNGIGGVRIFNDVRKTFLDSDFINVIGTGDLTNSNNYQAIGSQYTVTNNTYNIKNSFIFNNPNTNTPWTSGNFFSKANYPYYSSYYYTSGSFGVKKL